MIAVTWPGAGGRCGLGGSEAGDAPRPKVNNFPSRLAGDENFAVGDVVLQFCAPRVTV